MSLYERAHLNELASFNKERCVY